MSPVKKKDAKKLCCTTQQLTTSVVQKVVEKQQKVVRAQLEMRCRQHTWQLPVKMVWTRSKRPLKVDALEKDVKDVKKNVDDPNEVVQWVWRKWFVSKERVSAIPTACIRHEC